MDALHTEDKGTYWLFFVFLFQFNYVFRLSELIHIFYPVNVTYVYGVKVLLRQVLKSR
jgi:hypothetical protein